MTRSTFGAVVMGKAPVPGRVKTRLNLPGLVAADVYRAFLWDTCRRVDEALDKMGGGSRAFSCALAPDESLASVRPLVPEGWTVVRQHGDDLGQRMQEAWRSHPAHHTVVLGSDLPTLPASRIVEAWQCLSQADGDAVFVPAEDGGYVLFGLRHEAPELFQHIPWSTSSVMEATRQAASRAGWKVQLLASHYDVDTPADIRRLQQDLDGDSRSSKALARYAKWLKH